MQYAILLMPDENREALYTLLNFLNSIAANKENNSVSRSRVIYIIDNYIKNIIFSLDECNKSGNLFCTINIQFKYNENLIG